MSRTYPISSMIVCLLTVAIARSSFAATFVQTVAGNSYTVVEADGFFTGGVAGNTVDMNNPAQFWAVNNGGNQAGLYNWRDFGGINFNAPAGAAASAPDLFEVSSQTPAGPNLRTTVSVPNGTYSVYLVQMIAGPNAASQGLDAALLGDIDVGQSAPTTQRDFTQVGVIRSGIFVSPAAPNFELALSPLGQVTGSSIKVLLGPPHNPNNFGVRNEYIGIAYAAATPEPSSIVIMLIGAFSAIGVTRNRWHDCNRVSR